MILEENKEIYNSLAESVPGLMDKEKNQLCFEYVDIVDNDLKGKYLAAIITKFWYVIPYLYGYQHKKIATIEDCYNFFIDAVMYVLEKHSWTDENSNLFNDPKAAEKAILVRARSYLINYFVAQTRQKRSLNTDTSSYETFYENIEEDESSNDVSIDSINSIKDLFTEYINSKEYLEAFMIDVITNIDFFSNDDSGNLRFDKSKLKNFLKSIDASYIAIMSESYDVDFDKLMNASRYITGMTSDKLQEKIDKVLFMWSKNKTLIKFLQEG